VSVCADMEMPYYYHVQNAGGYVCAHSIVSVLSARLKIEMRERERAQHTHKVYSRGVGRRRLIGEAMRHPPCDFPNSLLLDDAPHSNLYTLGWPVAAHCYCCSSALISSRQCSVRSHTTGGLDMEGGGDEALVTRTPPDC
jgi:hypothetical protein